MTASLDVCAVGVYLRQVGGAVANEVDEHGNDDLILFEFNSSLFYFYTIRFNYD
jgi:hypothetical protein